MTKDDQLVECLRNTAKKSKITFLFRMHGIRVAL